ncbi:hypothetical protein ACH41E_29400 [Streptomyces sp. NPDC020412]|uniref:hypothetical protein n=1 Tax=Streptomyces sp. NPDC020412 TaxID=3365073 RepID=UPI0037A4BAB4
MTNEMGRAGTAPPRRTPASRRSDDLLPLLAGVACAAAGTGVTLALTGSNSPLRAPFTLLFLFLGPAAGLFAALHRLEPWVRASAAASGSLVVNLVLAAGLSWLEVPVVGIGVTAIVAVTALMFLWATWERRSGRTSTARPNS